MKESLYVIKQTWVFTKNLPEISRLTQHLFLKLFPKQTDKMSIYCVLSDIKRSAADRILTSLQLTGRFVSQSQTIHLK